MPFTRRTIIVAILAVFWLAGCHGVVRNDYPPHAAYYLYVHDKNLHSLARDEPYFEKLKDSSRAAQKKKAYLLNDLAVLYIYRTEGNRALKLWEAAIALAPEEIPIYENVFQAYYYLGARKTKMQAVANRLEKLGRSSLALARDARRRGDFSLAGHIYKTEISELRKKVSQLVGPSKKKGAKKKKKGAQAKSFDEAKGKGKTPETSKGKGGSDSKGKGKGKGKSKSKAGKLRKLAGYSRQLAVLYNYHGQAQAAAGNLSGAERSFEESLELQISRVLILEDITAVLVEEKKYTLAREYASLAYTGPGALAGETPTKKPGAPKKASGKGKNKEAKAKRAGHDFGKASGNLLRLYAWVEFKLGSFSTAGRLYDEILKRKPRQVFADSEFWREYYWFCLHAAEKERQKEVETLLSNGSISVKVDYKLLAGEYQRLREEDRKLAVKVLNLPKVKQRKDAPELQRIPDAKSLVGDVDPKQGRLVNKKNQAE